MKRPTGFTILSFFLGWLAIAGFGNAVIEFKSDHGSTLILVLASFYGVTALTSAIGLWKFKPWVYRSFLVWSIVVVATMLAFQFGTYNIYSVPLIAFIGISAFILVLLILVAIYIKNNLPAISQT